MSKAGLFEIDVWHGGVPIWCELRVDGKSAGKFTAMDLADLAHTVERAKVEARQVARTMIPTEVNDI